MTKLQKLFWEVFVKDCKINDEEVNSEDWEKIKKLDNSHLHSALKNFINNLLNFKEKVRNSEVKELAERLQQFETIIMKLEVDNRAHIAKHFQLRLDIETYKNTIEDLAKELQTSKQEVKKLKEKLSNQEKFLEKVKEKIEQKKKMTSSRKLLLETEIDVKHKSKSITERSKSSTNLVKVPVILSSSKSRLSRGRSHSSLSKPLKVQIQ
jgi:DNA repair exonuclease SbcCD ATPase subunit